MFKYLSFAVVSMGLVLGAQSASAGSVTYSTTVGPAELDWTMGTTVDTTQYITLPMFDPTLFNGAMPSAMTLSFSGFMATNPLAPAPSIVNFSNASSSNASVNGSWTFSAVNPSLIPDFVFNQSVSTTGITVASAIVPGFFGTPSINPIGGLTFAPMTGSHVYSPVPFVGPGNFTLAVTDTASVSFASLNTSAAMVQWFLIAGGNLSVTYEVPAPGALALLGLGLLGIGGLHRKKKLRA